MVAIIGLVCVALLLGVLLLMRSSTATRKAPTPKSAPNLKEGGPRSQGPRATGLN
jgi:hypothetical protein